MTLTEFIETNHGTIICEFEKFARTLMPAGSNMSPSELRDHAEELLTAIVADMDTRQSRNEELQKGKGLGIEQKMLASGNLHAVARLGHGFTLGHLAAEFRALRASVLRLYEQGGGTELTSVRRFNESIDEALTASITTYGSQTDLYRDQFVGILAHDLRNPLSAIQMGATVLTIAAKDDQRLARVAANILRSAARMGRMIEDVLDFTRERLGGVIPLKRERMDLEQLCREAILEAKAAHNNAVVNFECTGVLTGAWDRDRLAQVLSNLLGNAIQHGDGKAASLVARGESEEVVVAVHNAGLPIPREAIGTIFDPLVRSPAEEENLSNSIGLGLFIARAIVTGHGGQIDVTSSADRGTCFTVRLPRFEQVNRRRTQTNSNVT
jgi:signal transduction histidine kinase